jgi:hypothetical protein
MKYAVDMGSGATIFVYVPRFNEYWSRHSEVDKGGIHRHTHTA